MTEAGWPESAFWRFSLDVYGRPGVEAACLALQDGLGVDVNRLLLAFHLAERGERLDGDALDNLEADWQGEVIAPVRAVRRRLKRAMAGADLPVEAGCLGEIRKRLLAVELDLEHIAQLALERATFGRRQPAAPGEAVLEANLEAVFGTALARDVTASPHWAALKAALHP